MDAERGFQLFLLAASGLLTVLLLLPYLSVILGAVLLAYMLSTPHAWLADRVGDRLAAFGLIVATGVALLLPLVVLAQAVLTGLGDLLETVGQDGGLSGFDGLRGLLGSVFGIDVDGSTSFVDLLRQGDVLSLAQTALDTFGGVSEAFVQLTVLLFVWYYLLTDGDRLLAWLGEVVPLSEDAWDHLLERAEEVLYVVVIGNFVVAVADGLMVAIGLWLVGFSNIVFWAFVSVFLALIPLVGTMLVWVPAAVYLGLTGDVVPAVLLALYGFLIVGSVDNVLRPYLGAPEVGLEPAIFVVGVLAGLSFFGPVGIFYGPVLLVMTKAVYDTVGQAVQ
jgi:predicted PurR-regulated permease PerM